MTLRFALISAVKDLRRRAADPLAIVLWLGIPLLVGGMLALVVGGTGQTPRGTVLLADEDDGLVGRAIEAGLRQGPLGTLFEVQRTAAADGRAQLDAGDASALIIVPKGATDAVIDRTPLTLTVVTNPAQRILPGIVQEALELLVEGTFYLQRIFAEPLQRFRDRQPTGDDFPQTEQVTGLAASINDQLRGLRPVLFPPVLDVTLQQITTVEPGSSGIAGFGRLFLPGLLFMSLLFISQGMSGDIWEEHTQGTLRRVVSTPPGIVSLLIGKLLAGAVLFAAVTIVGLVLAVAAFGVPVGRALGALPWCVFGGTVLFALFLVPQVAASSQRVANFLGSLFVFPLMMIGGSFFPFETMPPAMAMVGRWTPNGQAVARLKEILDGSAAAGTLVGASVAMALPACLALLWSATRLRRRFGGGA